MKVSSILVISVIIKQHNRVIFRHIFSLYMKVSSILVISVILYLHNRVVFGCEHEGVRYQCDSCDYQAKRLRHLHEHIEAKHTDNILLCELCDYQTKWKNNFNVHLKTHKQIEDNDTKMKKSKI